MIEVPADIPVAIPVEPTVAIPVDTLLQTPPAVASVSVAVVPGHITGNPIIVPAAGSGLTVTTTVAAAVPQLLLTVYEIVAVPAVTPVTTPEVPIVATPVGILLHAPPPAASVSAVVAVAHTIGVPVMIPAEGMAITVTTVVAAVVPQLLLTV